MIFKVSRRNDRGYWTELSIRHTNNGKNLKVNLKSNKKQISINYLALWGAFKHSLNNMIIKSS